MLKELILGMVEKYLFDAKQPTDLLRFTAVIYSDNRNIVFLTQNTYYDECRKMSAWL